jgi:hypothetical protein
VGDGTLLYWCPDFIRFLECMLFVYSVGASIVYFLCTRIAPFCAFSIILTLIKKKKNTERMRLTLQRGHLKLSVY